jgi:chromosome segregation ATPase
MIEQKEKAANKDIRKKLDELKEKSSSLRTQRMELNNKLVEAEAATNYLKVMQQELESALVDKENHIKQLQDETSDGFSNRIAELTQFIQQKDSEIEDLKRRLSDRNTPQKTEEQPKVTENSTIAETKTNENDQASSADSKEEKWVTVTANLEETNQNSDKQKEGRQNLEVKVDGEGTEKSNGEGQVIQGNSLNENVNVDTVTSGGEGAKNEGQQAAGGSGARKLKMFATNGI